MSGVLRFWKMCGAGNDFIVADARDGLGVDSGELAKRLCPRHTSVGADGLLLIRSIEGDTAEVEYRNSDGSEAEFCGNGARCAARFVREILAVSTNPLSLRFAGATVRAEVDEAGVRVMLPMPDAPKRLVRPGLEDLELWSVRAGVPHVLEASEKLGPPTRAIDSLVLRLSRDDPGLLEDSNVSVISLEGEETIRIATRERGALLTLACGSAAVAAARLASEGRERTRWILLPPGGLPLIVTLGEEGALLEGEARLVYSGEVDI